MAREVNDEAIAPYLEAPENLSRQECLDLAELVTESGGIAGALLVAGRLTELALNEIRNVYKNYFLFYHILNQNF